MCWNGSSEESLAQTEGHFGRGGDSRTIMPCLRLGEVDKGKRLQRSRCRPERHVLIRLAQQKPSCGSYSCLKRKLVFAQFYCEFRVKTDELVAPMVKARWVPSSTAEPRSRDWLSQVLRSIDHARSRILRLSLSSVVQGSSHNNAILGLLSGPRNLPSAQLQQWRPFRHQLSKSVGLSHTGNPITKFFPGPPRVPDSGSPPRPGN